MNLTYESLNIFLLLVPGFISSRILESVITRKETASKLNTIIEALIFSFLIYTIVNLVTSWAPLVIATKEKAGNTTYALSTDTKLIVYILLLSVVIPLILGALIHHDVHTKIFRKLKISDKTSRHSVWQDVYVTEKRHIIAHLENDRRIYGWPMYYSHDPSDAYLYLFQPAWILDDGSFLECDTHGILLKKDKIDFIEFTKKRDEDLSKLV